MKLFNQVYLRNVRSAAVMTLDQCSGFHWRDACLHPLCLKWNMTPFSLVRTLWLVSGVTRLLIYPWNEATPLIRTLWLGLKGGWIRGSPLKWGLPSNQNTDWSQGWPERESTVYKSTLKWSHPSNQVVYLNDNSAVCVITSEQGLLTKWLASWWGVFFPVVSWSGSQKQQACLCIFLLSPPGIAQNN